LRSSTGEFSNAAASGGNARFSELVPNGQGTMMQLVPSAERRTLVADVIFWTIIASSALYALHASSHKLVRNNDLSR
jgi:hypothetical protein